MLASLSIETFEHAQNFWWELLDQKDEVRVLICVRNVAEEIEGDSDVCLDRVTGEMFCPFLADVVDVIMKSPLEQGHTLFDLFDVRVSCDDALPDYPAILHKVIEFVIVCDAPEIFLNRLDDPASGSLIHV